MARFDFSNKQVSIVDDSGHRLNLNPQEALDLLHWLFDHKDTLYDLAHQGKVQGQSGERLLEIHLYQEHLEHLDKLKAAIPALHERKPAVILGAPMDLVTERAIELLKELQLEYKIHPLLEEDDAFAQGLGRSGRSSNLSQWERDIVRPAISDQTSESASAVSAFGLHKNQEDDQQIPASTSTMMEDCICDNGIGIPAEHLGRIFDRFHRLDTRLTREVDGLAIYKRIIELHHGSIWTESSPGEGSTFHVLLPVADAGAREEETLKSYEGWITHHARQENHDSDCR